MVACLEACDLDLRQWTQLDFDELSVSFDVVPFQTAPIDLKIFWGEVDWATEALLSICTEALDARRG